MFIKDKELTCNCVEATMLPHRGLSQEAPSRSHLLGPETFKRECGTHPFMATYLTILADPGGPKIPGTALRRRRAGVAPRCRLMSSHLKSERVEDPESVDLRVGIALNNWYEWFWSP